MKKLTFVALVAACSLTACKPNAPQAPVVPAPTATVDWEALVNDEGKYQAARQKCLEVPMSDMPSDAWCNAVNRANGERAKKMTSKKYGG